MYIRRLLTAFDRVFFHLQTRNHPSVRDSFSIFFLGYAKSLFSYCWYRCCQLVPGFSRDSRYSAQCRSTFAARPPLFLMPRTSCNFRPADCIEFRSRPLPVCTYNHIVQDNRCVKIHNNNARFVKISRTNLMSDIVIAF